MEKSSSQQTISLLDPSSGVDSNDEDQMDHNKPGKSSIGGGIFNLSNVIIGSGIIGLPNAVRQAGFFFGIGLLVFCAIITNYSLRIVVEAGVKARKYDYEELVSYCFGRNGYRLALFIILFLDFGAMVSYVVIIGDTVTPVLSYYVGEEDSFFADRTNATLLVTGVFMLPLSLFRSLRELSFVSIVSVCSVLLVIGVVAVEGLRGNFVPKEQQTLSLIDTEVFTAFGTMSFAYVCHDVSFQVFQSLEDRSREGWAKVSHGSIAIALCFSLAMCLTGYFSFFETLDSNILDNFADDNHVANAARLVLAMTIVMTYPLNLFMSRHVIARIVGLESSNQFRTMTHIIVSILLFGTSILLGILIEDLGIVQSMVGGISAVAIAFILPAACALQVGKLQNGTPWLTKSNWRLLLLLAFGVIVSITSTVQTIMEEIL